MAIFHLEAAMISRGKNQSVIAAAAYEARERIKSEQDNRTRNYAYKGGLIDKGIALPEGAADWMGDRTTLWNAVEHRENESKHWRTAQLARRFIYAVPAELSQAEQITLTKEIAESLARRGMVVDYAIHAPDKEGDERNTHAHFITTLRDVKDGQFQNKNRGWNDKEYLKELRADICGITNKHLEKYGIRVDHRSYEEQGIDKTPTQHKGVNIIAHERRLRRVSKELKQKENEALGEVLEAIGDIQLEQNIRKTQQATIPRSENQKTAVQQAEPLKSSAVENTPKLQERQEMEKEKPEPPKNKEELFVAICINQRPYIRLQLMGEMEDLQKRNDNIRQGGYDESYSHDKRIVEATRKLYNEAQESKDFEKWNRVYHSMYNEPDAYPRDQHHSNFKYANSRYTIWEKIRQPFLKMSKELFPEEKKQQQERTQTRGRSR